MSFSRRTTPSPSHAPQHQWRTSTATVRPAFGGSSPADPPRHAHRPATPGPAPHAHGPSPWAGSTPHVPGSTPHVSGSTPHVPASAGRPSGSDPAGHASRPHGAPAGPGPAPTPPADAASGAAPAASPHDVPAGPGATPGTRAAPRSATHFSAQHGPPRLSAVGDPLADGSGSGLQGQRPTHGPGLSPWGARRP